MTTNRALDACVRYDHWASEVQRLTEEIGKVACPREAGDPSEESESCFREASRIRTGSGSFEEPGRRRLYLDEIAYRVAECPECARLCGLIEERRTARRKLGAAKRWIRAVAKRAARTTEGGESDAG